MIRVASIAVFLVLYFLIGIPAWGVLWIVGKFDEEKKQRMALSMVQGGFRCILKLCSATKTTVIGRERIPRDQAVLYVGNHRSFFDILIIYTLVPDLTGFVAKKEMEKIPLLSNWMRNVNCLFLDRENIREGLKAIMEGVDHVKNGISVWIFPEGTRNDAENYLDLMPFKEGSLKIAEKTGCPVVPVAITGTAEAFESHYPRICSSQVTIEFGEPFIIPARGHLPASSGEEGGSQDSARDGIRVLPMEKKKVAGACARDMILDMLLKEKELREEN